MASGQLPSKENCPPVGVGVSIKIRVSFMVGGNQTISRSKIAPWLALGFVLVLVLGLGGNFVGGNCPRTCNNSYKNFKKIFRGLFETIFFSTFHSALCIIFIS